MSAPRPSGLAWRNALNPEGSVTASESWDGATLAARSRTSLAGWPHRLPYRAHHANSVPSRPSSENLLPPFGWQAATVRSIRHNQSDTEQSSASNPSKPVVSLLSRCLSPTISRAHSRSIPASVCAHFLGSWHHPRLPRSATRAPEVSSGSRYTVAGCHSSKLPKILVAPFSRVETRKKQAER